MKYGIIIDENGNRRGKVRKDSAGNVSAIFNAPVPAIQPGDGLPTGWRVVWDTFDLGLADIQAVVIA